MLKHLRDSRGLLTWTDDPRWCRAYWITETKPHTVRGEHAHRLTTRLIACIRGGFDFYEEQAAGEFVKFRMKPGMARTVPPMAWTRFSAFEYGTVVLCVADKPYDREEMVIDYEAWRAEVSSLRSPGADDLVGESGV